MKDDLVVKNGIIIPQHELKMSASRAGGPGGQHVNKASTRMSIRWNITQSKAINNEQKDRLLTKLKQRITDEGELVVHNGSTRSQAQNKKLALDQLARLIRKGLYVPKKRKKTAVPEKAKEARIEAKKQRGALKKMRSKKIVIN